MEEGEELLCPDTFVMDDRHVEVNGQDSCPYEGAEGRGGGDKALDLTDGIEVYTSRVWLVVVDQVIKGTHNVAQGRNKVGDGEVRDDSPRPRANIFPPKKNLEQRISAVHVKTFRSCLHATTVE